ncbi:MAG: hypothetical protein JNL47_09585 [Bacteroidia bacterium]|nr:hypothetical protein [Bacteroidia bacterium]
MINFGLWITYLLVIGAVAAAIIFPVMHIARNPKAAKGTFIGLGLLLGIFLISLILSSGQVNEKYGISAGQSKMIGAGLTMIYLLGFGAIVVAIYTEVKKAFGK